MNRVGKFAAALAAGLVLAPAALAKAKCDLPFSDVYRKIAPSVLRIFTVGVDPFSLMNRVDLSVGAGVVFDDVGHIVTNAHVVYDKKEIFVSTDGKTMEPATLVGADPVSDLAVIKSARSATIRKAPLGGSDGPDIGTEVLAIGFPMGLDLTATRGIVSGKERVIPFSPLSWLTPLMQTDAAVNPGNSGGPLIDRCGAVIGINTLSSTKAQNLNFAIPVALVRPIVDELVKNGRVVRPWHGIYGRIVPPALVVALGVRPGFLVETVEPGSPAERIGLKGGTFPVAYGFEKILLGGDVITQVNGTPLSDMDTVVRIVRSLKVGDTVALEYWRGPQKLTAEVKLPERPILPGDLRRFRERPPPE